MDKKAGDFIRYNPDQVEPAECPLNPGSTFFRGEELFLYLFVSHMFNRPEDAEFFYCGQKHFLMIFIR